MKTYNVRVRNVHTGGIETVKVRAKSSAHALTRNAATANGITLTAKPSTRTWAQKNFDRAGKANDKAFKEDMAWKAAGDKKVAKLMALRGQKKSSGGGGGDEYERDDQGRFA